MTTTSNNIHKHIPSFDERVHGVKTKQPKNRHNKFVKLKEGKCLKFCLKKILYLLLILCSAMFRR